MRISLAALGVGWCVCGRAQVVVNEAGIHAHLVNSKTVVTLALTSQRKQPVRALIELQWLGLASERDEVERARVTLPPGQSSIETPMPLSTKIADPLLERLRYQIDPAGRGLAEFVPVKGIVSFANIADYAFSLRVIAPSIVQPGKEYELRVLAVHPVTGQLVAGVHVAYGRSGAISGKDGVTVLPVASDLAENNPNYVTAQIGDLSRRQGAPEITAARGEVRIQCDKPIYQPGQTMHVRILALAPDGKAEAGAEHSIKIFNESEDVEDAAMLTTSRFGIAATDWEIPTNAKPGEYRIQVDDEGEDGELPATRTVNIRRYELPSFRVSVHLDRTYYLPHQTAAIEVGGEYLFGKPVSTGKVQITEGDEGLHIGQGELNADGRFRTTLELNEPKFGDAKFIDRHFTAFITDSSTNRTEQHKFDVRISCEPLHIYIAKEESTRNGQRLWITTYSPDGAPARSDVTVLGGTRVLAEGRTSRFGLVRLDLPQGNGDFLVRAVTHDGRQAEERLAYQNAESRIWLETDRTLYRQGETVHCRVSAAEKNAAALLLAWNPHGQVLFSQDIHFKDGAAVVNIPFDPKFGKEVAIGVVSGALGPAASRTVVFPSAGELGIQVVPVKAEYRPGEMARIELRASTKAALGIAIVDQSVLERASTDAAFGPRPWFDYEMDQRNSVGGIRYADLLNLNPAKIDDDLQQVAEVLVESPVLQESLDQSLQNRENAYMGVAQREIQPLKNALDEHYLRTLAYPRDENSYLEIAGGVPGTLLDPWMDSYFPRFSTEGPNDVLRICTAGPDKQIGTEDDFCALEIQRRWFARFESIMRDALVRVQDYPATTDEFMSLLDRAGLRFNRLKDPWEMPVRCSIVYERDRRAIRIQSGARPPMGNCRRFYDRGV